MIHIPLEACPVCGSEGILNEPNYADELVTVSCEQCDATTEAFPMGPYNEGIDRAVDDWNEGKVL